ncbi:MAG: carbohydrate porin [Methylocystis sp.]|nr:carbohydrate porin [Methylocystis sp.]
MTSSSTRTFTGEERVVLTSPAHVSESIAAPASEQPSISSSVPALGDFKKALLDRGFNLQVNYTGEVFGNPSGGVKRGAIYEGLLEMAVDGDLDKIAGLTGASFHIDAYQIHGRGLSTCCIFNFSTISSIEARATTRLFDAWLEQKLFGDAASIRVGQLAADAEFFISELGALYVNGTFGWPNITSADLPSGGPAYPLATPGVRLKVSPNDQITLLAAAFNGDPSGARFTGLQEFKDPAGINFRLKDPPFVIGEAQVKHNQDNSSSGLAGTIKLGVWRHFSRFDDQRFGTDALSLADPSSNGVPLPHRGDWGVYGVIDQMIWRASADAPKKGAGVFARLSASPSDRNMIDFYAEGGVNFMGLLDARPDDAFGLAAAYSEISSSLRGLDRDNAFFAQTASPIRDDEVALELAYQAQVIPGWIVQPDFQYIFHPGGGAIDPASLAVRRIRDAAVFGLRTTVKY